MFTQIQDLWAVPVWGTLLLMLAVWLRKTVPLFAEGGKEYGVVLVLKLVSGMVLGALYQYYYGYGDTLRYFFSGSVMRGALLEDPSAGALFFFGDTGQVPPDLKETAMLIPYWKHQASALLVARISGLLSFLTLNSYYANSLFFSFFSFTGVWALYCTVLYYLPGQERWMKWAILYLPSLIFWGSGLFKDPLTLGLTGWWIWALHSWIQKRTQGWVSLLVLVLASAGLFFLKVYILLVWIPFGILWVVLERGRKIQHPGKKKVFLTTSLFAGLGVAALLVTILTVFYPQFAWDLLMESIVANRNELLFTDKYYGGSEGSRFDIGEFDPSLGGILKKVPAGLFAALYRPGIIDLKSPIMLPAILENTLILLLTLRWLIRTPVRYWFEAMKGRPVLWVFLAYALFFSCFVGLSTSNFGTLLRYRLPSLPFFLVVIMALNIYGRRREGMLDK